MRNQSCFLFQVRPFPTFQCRTDLQFAHHPRWEVDWFVPETSGEEEMTNLSPSRKSKGRVKFARVIDD